MKTILLLISVLFALPASGQLITKFYGPQYVERYRPSDTTNTLPVLSTNGYFTIDVPRGTNLALMVGYQWHATPGAGDAPAPTIEFFRGIDTGRFESNRWTVWRLPAATGTTPVSEMTNLPVSSVAFIRGRFLNASTNAIGSNIFLVYGFKN
jgi:hypothetical protein